MTSCVLSDVEYLQITARILAMLRACTFPLAASSGLHRLASGVPPTWSRLRLGHRQVNPSREPLCASTHFLFRACNTFLVLEYSVIDRAVRIIFSPTLRAPGSHPSQRNEI